MLRRNLLRRCKFQASQLATLLPSQRRSIDRGPPEAKASQPPGFSFLLQSEQPPGSILDPYTLLLPRRQTRRRDSIQQLKRIKHSVLPFHAVFGLERAPFQPIP